MCNYVFNLNPMPLTFPTPSAARDDLDGLLLLGGQPTGENLVATTGCPSISLLLLLRFPGIAENVA